MFQQRQEHKNGLQFNFGFSFPLNVKWELGKRSFNEDEDDQESEEKDDEDEDDLETTVQNGWTRSGGQTAISRMPRGLLFRLLSSCSYTSSLAIKSFIE